MIETNGLEIKKATELTSKVKLISLAQKKLNFNV